MNDDSAPTLLLVDDDENFRERLARSFIKKGYRVFTAANGVDALATAAQETPEFAVVDLRLQGEWGLNIVRSLLEADKETTIVLLTAYGSIATAMEAVRLGAKGFLQKPAGADEIESALLGREQMHGAPEESDTPTLARAEWEHINRVLTECNGNILRAAQVLGLHRRTLQRKLQKFPVRR